MRRQWRQFAFTHRRTRPQHGLLVNRCSCKSALHAILASMCAVVWEKNGVASIRLLSTLDPHEQKLESQIHAALSKILKIPLHGWLDILGVNVVRSEDDGGRELRGIGYLTPLYHEGVAPSVDDATKSQTAALRIPFDCFRIEKKVKYKAEKHFTTYPILI